MAVTNKRKAWELIKERQPDIADHLKAINEAFGKPSAVAIKRNDNNKVFFKTGRFDQGKDLVFKSNFKSKFKRY